MKKSFSTFIIVLLFFVSCNNDKEDLDKNLHSEYETEFTQIKPLFLLPGYLDDDKIRQNRILEVSKSGDFIASQTVKDTMLPTYLDRCIDYDYLLKIYNNKASIHIKTKQYDDTTIYKNRKYTYKFKSGFHDCNGLWVNVTENQINFGNTVIGLKNYQCDLYVYYEPIIKIKNKSVISENEYNGIFDITQQEDITILRNKERTYTFKTNLDKGYLQQIYPEHENDDIIELNLSRNNLR